MLPLLTALLLASCLADQLDPREQFSKFKQENGKAYSSLGEEEVRFNQFQENLVKIEKHNADGHSWRMGVTKFADLSKYESLALLRISFYI